MKKKRPMKLLVGLLCAALLLVVAVVAVILDSQSPDPILGIFRTETEAPQETQSVAEETQTPVEETECATEGTEDPTENTEEPVKPTEETPTKPTEESTKPTEGEEDPTKPTEGTEDPTKPTEGTEDPTKPTEGTEDPTKPTEGEEDPTKPTEGEEDPTKPTEGEEDPTKPTEGEEDPTEPTEGEEDPTKPTEGTEDPTKPTEGEEDPTKPTEGEEDPTEPTEGTEDPTEGEEEPTQPEERVLFPYQIPGYSVVIDRIAPYTGMFVEAGGNVQIENVAMLLVSNNGGEDIEYAQISVVYGQETLIFDISALPAGQKVVVQEKNAKTLPEGDVDSVAAVVAQGAGMDMAADQIQVTDNGNNTLTIKNLTNKTISSVRIFYKYYMEEEDMFVGGIAFTVQISRLGAGASITIQPSHYTSQTSRVVMVRIYD